MAIYNNRVCKQCGIVFAGGPRAWYCPECGAERRKEQGRINKQKARAKATRQIGSIDFCLTCGGKYTVNSGLQRYCPKCAPARYKETDQKQSLAYYAKNKETVNPQRNEKRRQENVCVICGTVFYSPTRKNTCSEECKKERTRQIGRKTDQKRRKSAKQCPHTVGEIKENEKMETLKWIVIESDARNEVVKVCTSKEEALRRAEEIWNTLSTFDRKRQTITVALANMDEEGNYAELGNGLIDADLYEVAKTYGE